MTRKRRSQQTNRNARKNGSALATRNTPALPKEHKEIEMEQRIGVAKSMAFSGPIPHPDLFEKYGEVLFDAPERILSMAEREASHRHKLEDWNVKGDVCRALLGVVSALLITAGFLYSGYILVMNGHDVVGTVFAGGCLVSLAGTFIFGTVKRRQATEN